MEIYLIRHTRVDVQPGTCYGQSDVPLASSFEEEAAQVRSGLDALTFDRVYSSPLGRCTRLANYLFSEQYRTDERLVEFHFGEWEMLTWDDIYDRPHGKAWMDNYLTTTCPGGESLPMLVARVENFLNDLKKEPLERCAIVTHAGVIRACSYLVEGIALKSSFGREVEHGSIGKYLI